MTSYPESYLQNKIIFSTLLDSYDFLGITTQCLQHDQHMIIVQQMQMILKLMYNESGMISSVFFGVSCCYGLGLDVQPMRWGFFTGI